MYSRSDKIFGELVSKLAIILNILLCAHGHFEQQVLHFGYCLYFVIYKKTEKIALITSSNYW